MFSWKGQEYPGIAPTSANCLMACNSPTVTLGGNGLKIYRFILKARKPVGIREVQRELSLSSPSVAARHISKLEEAGLVKKDGLGYITDKIVLQHLIRIRGNLIPKSMFNCTFFMAALIMQLTIFAPQSLNAGYLFSIGTALTGALIFLYETINLINSETL